MDELTIDRLKVEAQQFAARFSGKPIHELFGITDGKAVGTYVEIELHEHLRAEGYSYRSGSAASGVDFPDLEVDVKATSIRQPQSSSPFRTASQKVYGLGHHLLVFVYSKLDDAASAAARLEIQHIIFVAKERTGDYQTTRGLVEILRRDGNLDDIQAFLEERNLPLDEIGRQRLAERILEEPPLVGYLTVSNALQWRLQFSRAITTAASGSVDGGGPPCVEIWAIFKLRLPWLVRCSDVFCGVVPTARGSGFSSRLAGAVISSPECCACRNRLARFRVSSFRTRTCGSHATSNLLQARPAL